MLTKYKVEGMTPRPPRTSWRPNRNNQVSHLEPDGASSATSSHDGAKLPYKGYII